MQQYVAQMAHAFHKNVLQFIHSFVYLFKIVCWCRNVHSIDSMVKFMCAILFSAKRCQTWDLGKQGYGLLVLKMRGSLSKSFVKYCSLDPFGMLDCGNAHENCALWLSTCFKNQLARLENGEGIFTDVYGTVAPRMYEDPSFNPS